ncbi:alanine--tRNA ligase [Pseudoteredinibacter isoporae]|uniref:Alanine--tRNA ligase n=1 Tax=Pseudoteredinibacter isoporae TaxID=570281 RepID=A0A7X0MXI3_9GAMM|nr:alanine--tRNA ligase [Pseudoteredinibacter isoporae]MBB6523518.1 alanyl-tRNA synthetase [Pseudoteredinibacter isoporae]
MMKSAEIRQAFLNFFQSKQHQIVASSSLVPGNDPTLLFTNAGMVQFKDVFLGDDQRNYSRATSSQRCVRAGGKHNDLENVGYTARHHTFFEMLGNFSFGDYFKRDAISFAWEFLTSEEWLGISKDKLMVTVYQEDDEAFDLWHKEMGVPVEKIVRIGDKGGRYQSDNFWSMGDTGPCGPCTEIFYDHGEDIWGGPPGSPEEDGDRFIEIWNVVFMQFNRSADGTMSPLPKPSVDTGMGLERIAAVMQNVHSNYEIDLFQYLLQATAKATNTDDMENKSLRVIADHIRSCAFLVVDGVIPSNEGRGYVLRRIVRRAIRHGHKLGQKQAFFHTLVQALVDQMGEAYPELKQQQAQIEKVLLTEEQQFEKTLDKGMAVLESELADLKAKEIPGQLVFTLYDTYGFPVDLTNDIAREREMSIDLEGYETLMEAQRQRARAAGSFKVDYNDSLDIDGDTDFTGYNKLEGSSKVVALFKEGDACEQLQAGDRGIVVLDATPFYAESGGQVGDQGELSINGTRFVVEDCAKQGSNHLHIGTLAEGSLSLGDSVNATVTSGTRQATALNHSATHLLHAALRKVLGDHVTQKGSLVDAERLRFDFSHFEAVTAAELKTIEAMVNEQIRANTAVQTDVCDMETAKNKGAMALFGEKYGDTVRVLSMGTEQFSVELCGGTHVERTGDIGLFRITSESGIAAGVRRIEALTGEAAMQNLDAQQAQLQEAAKLLKSKPEELVVKLQGLLDQQKTLEKDLKAAKAKLASAASGDMLSKAVEIQGVKVLAVQLTDVDPKSLRDSVDQFKNKLGSSIIMVAVVDGEKISLVAGVSKDLTDRFKAGELMKHVASQVGGKGGGRPDMAQGGGDQPENLDAALASVNAWVEEKI